MKRTGQFSRRRFLALGSAATAHAALYAKPAPPVAASAGARSLAGVWRFSLDRDDAGVTQRWAAKELPATEHISLPGILQSQGFGDEITATTPFVAALPRDMRWYLLPQYEAYTKPGHVEVPYLSQPVRHYLGVAWYQREIEIPAGWKEKRVVLHLERTRWQTTVYLDGGELGTCHTLVAPHEYELGYVSPGRHRISIRIDNRMILPYRPDGHSVSDAEGSTWNGIVGRIELKATSPVWIDDAQVYPSLGSRSARIKVRIGNLAGREGSGTLSAGGVSTRVSWTETGGDAVLDVPIPDARPWSEFAPVLQKLNLRLTGASADDSKSLVFGMREIKAEGKNILLNGEILNLRTTHDGGGFPLTGYPATDVASWRRIIHICKEWGLNGIRFHSWCPPDAAFTAGDELGFYFQPECGMWNSFDPERKMLDVLHDETARLLKAYGNHPSLILLNATNEPAGHYQEQLPEWDRRWREADPRRLYSDGTGRPAVPAAGQPYAADYIVTPRGRGPHGWFGADYEVGLHDLPCPAVGHEVGQWCAYPDFDVIGRFTGYMHPGNYIIMRDSARENGLLAQNKALVYASGRFQLACYKEEVEASLRTPSYSGFELLDLHDYLGQGGALIGLLDAFWETKSYATAAEFRRFCNTTVPLVRLKERVYRTSDAFSVEAEVAHFGSAALTGISPRWEILNAAGKAVATGALSTRDIARGKNIPLGTISADLRSLPAPAQYRLVVELGDTGFKNDWKFWVYPAATEARATSDVLVTALWPEAQTQLASGGKVLFLSGAPEVASPDLQLTTVPIFWNRLMNPSRTWMLGLLCDTKHGSLAGFPTESGCDWQWVDLLPRTSAMNVTTLTHELQPVVQAIDDWNRNLRLAMLFECSSGAGRLMVTSLDLNADRPTAVALRRSVVDYMESTHFAPAVAIAPADLERWMGERYSAGHGFVKPKATPSNDLVDPGQIHPQA